MCDAAYTDSLTVLGLNDILVLHYKPSNSVDKRAIDSRSR